MITVSIAKWCPLCFLISLVESLLWVVQTLRLSGIVGLTLGKTKMGLMISFISGSICLLLCIPMLLAMRTHPCHGKKGIRIIRPFFLSSHHYFFCPTFETFVHLSGQPLASWNWNRTLPVSFWILLMHFDACPMTSLHAFLPWQCFGAKGSSATHSCKAFWSSARTFFDFRWGC